MRYEVKLVVETCTHPPYARLACEMQLVLWMPTVAPSEPNTDQTILCFKGFLCSPYSLTETGRVFSGTYIRGSHKA